jgi:3-phosphoshikimate 1-carboxyvinyltransferase
LPGLGTEEGDDLLVASDPALATKLAGRNARIKIETYHDHRIAMSFALAGLRLPGIVILDPACTGKTYPAYWDMLAGLGVELQPTA